MDVRTCKRHPDEATRLSCTSCGDPICLRCAIDAPVGQKCPACGRQPRTARAAGKPRQYVKAAAAGFGAAVGVAIGLAVLAMSLRFGVLIASGFGGYAVARAVHWGAESNRARPFEVLGYGLAVVSVQGAAILLPFVPLIFTGFWVLAYPAAAYGAYLFYR
jgi:hypothetical protein